MSYQFQARGREDNVDPTQLYSPSSCLLVVSDLATVSNRLSGCGDQGHQLAELGSEVIDVSWVNREEEIGLGLLGKAHSVEGEFGGAERDGPVTYKTSP